MKWAKNIWKKKPWDKKEDNWGNNDYQGGTPRKVIITVTATETGWALVSTYPEDNDKKYVVPLYKCTIEGTDETGGIVIKTFDVIRFGVQLDATKNVTSPKVVGFKDEQSYTLKMIGYMDMSWQMKGGWYVHEGASDPQKQAWGAIGCIEVTGPGGWTDFNQTILELTGADSYKEVSDEKVLIINIEAVSKRPPLKEY